MPVRGQELCRCLFNELPHAIRHNEKAVGIFVHC
jgi:hypothetical protein